MNIKKIFYQYYESMGNTFTLEFKGGELQYSTNSDSDPIIKNIDPIVDEDTDWKEVIVQLDSIPSNNIAFTSKKLERFTDFIKSNCSDWKKKYKLEGFVLDGTMWKVDIQIDDVKLKSEGQIVFPDNFEDFTYELSLFTGGKMFMK